MVVKNIIAEDMPFTKSIFEQFWRSYCKKTIFVVFHFLKFLPYYISTEIQYLEFANYKSTSKNVASSWEALTPSKSRVISPIICCAWPFCLRYAVEATWKYISDNKNKYLLHLLTAPGFLICPNSDFCRSAKRISARLPVYLSCRCSVNNFDFLTPRHFHLSMLGLLRNNCQFITQVGISERLCIVFSCRQIKKNLPLTEFHFDELDWVRIT